MKKILVNFVALHGGGTADAYQMVKALVENGCEVYAILSSCMENIDLWRKIEKLTIFEVKGYSTKLNYFPRLLKFLLVDFYRIKKAIRNIDFDVVYIPMISYWTYHIYKKFKHIRTIYTMHDVRPHDEKTNSYIWKCSEKIARQCDDVIILSECFKNIVAKRYNKEGHITVIPLGNQPYYKRENKMNKSDLFEFVFYGRIDDYKGLDILGEAFYILSKNHENIHLTIAGSGDFTKYRKIFERIESSKLTIINRWIKDDEVSSFFNYNKSITIIPYKNATQSGIIPIAMNFKSLVISTNCSGLKEQIEDGRTGFLIEPCQPELLAKKMSFVIENWDECLSIIDNAYNYIESCSWTNLSKILIGLL